MTRKTLVSIIALIYTALGLMSFCTSWVPSSSQLLVFKWLPLVGGALAAFAGFAMFRLSETGRKVVVLLLSIRVVMNSWLLVRVPQNSPALGVTNRFGGIIYRIESPYILQGYLLGWIIIAVLLIVFLSQTETKAIFAPEVIEEKEPDIIFE